MSNIINGSFVTSNICDTYRSILNIGGSNCSGTADTLESGAKCRVRDSAGTNSSLQLGVQAEGICVDGNSTFANNVQVLGTFSSGAATLASAAIAGQATTGTTMGVGTNLTVGGDVTVNTNKLTVTSSCTCTTNNTCVGGTLNTGGNLGVTGCITATNDVIAFSTSDKKFKKNLNKICNTKTIIDGLNGYSFDWNEQSGREGRDLGIIAQDAQEVLPEIVHTREDGSLAVDYPKIIPVLIEEIKRLSKEVEELKNS